MKGIGKEMEIHTIASAGSRLINFLTLESLFRNHLATACDVDSRSRFLHEFELSQESPSASSEWIRSASEKPGRAIRVQ